MDFHLDEDLLAVQDLARRIIGEHATPERLREVEVAESPVDDRLWSLLADSGLVGLALPGDLGGEGLGLDALAVVLEEQGRRVAPVPLWSAVVAARALSRSDAGEDRALVPSLAAGRDRVALAVEEYSGDPGHRSCRADRDGGSWRLTGTKALVPSGAGSSRVVVSAATEEGDALFVVDGDATGLAWDPVRVTTHDVAADLCLDGCAARMLGATEAVDLVLAEATLALAALQLGVSEGALTLATEHLRQREQFGRPLGSFQAVQQQLADCWIDLEAMRVTLWQGLDEVAVDPCAASARRAVLVAGWWSSQAGLDVVHRVQHLHGGIGVDLDYPVHRHFLWGKQISGTLGGGAATLEALGDLLAGVSAPDRREAP